MKEKKINEILYSLRIEEGIGQEKLSCGLCTKGAYSKYESGERRIDRLLLNALIQRMGKSADKLSAVLTPEEYDYFRWKKKVLKAAGTKDMNIVEKLLKKSEAIEIVINRDLQQQFFCQMKAYVIWERNGDLEQAIALLKQASDLTMPNLKADNMQQYLISAEEMQILLELARLQTQKDCKVEAVIMLMKIADYVERNYNDYEIKVKVYPKTIRLLYPLLLQQQRELEGVMFCKKAMELLCWQGVLYDLKEIMEGYLLCSEGFAKEERKRKHIRKQLWALCEVYEEFEADQYLPEGTMLFYNNQEMYLMDEVIRKNRIEKGMSQELLSEGICSPENLSRIERGKGAPNPRNFRALMQKLETGQDYYNGKLDTNDFLLLEKQKELDRAISLKDWQEAFRLLQYLKSKVDLTLPLNRQTLQDSENRILFFKKEISQEEFLKRCDKALGCEGEKWRDEQFWQQFFTEYKAGMLVNIAFVYHRMNQTEKSIFILEHLLEELKRSKVRLADRYVTSMTVVENLSSYYEATGMYEKCMGMCGRGIELCFKSGRGVRLAVFLDNKAEIMNDITPDLKEKSKDYLQKAYYLSDLMSVHNSTAYIDQYYRVHYDANVQWY